MDFYLRIFEHFFRVFSQFSPTLSNPVRITGHLGHVILLSAFMFIHRFPPLFKCSSPQCSSSKSLILQISPQSHVLFTAFPDSTVRLSARPLSGLEQIFLYPSITDTTKYSVIILLHEGSEVRNPSSICCQCTNLDIHNYSSEKTNSLNLSAITEYSVTLAHQS